MSKRTHRKRDSHMDNDKPDYAADYPVRKAKAKEKDDDKAHVKEHLQGNVLNKLNRLKATLQKKEASVTDSKGQTTKRGAKPVQNRNHGGTNNNAQAATPDEKKSFAELFEPEEEDDVSFEDMLKDSKLDWRKFK